MRRRSRSRCSPSPRPPARRGGPTPRSLLAETQTALDAGADAGEVSTARYREIDAALDRVATELAAAQAAADQAAAEQAAAEQAAAEQAAAEQAAAEQAARHPHPPRSRPHPKGKGGQGRQVGRLSGSGSGRSPMRPACPWRHAGGVRPPWPAREEQHHGHHPRRHGSTGPGPAGRRPRAGRCVRRPGSAVRHRAVPRAAAVRPHPVRPAGQPAADLPAAVDPHADRAPGDRRRWTLLRAGTRAAVRCRPTASGGGAGAAPGRR